MSNGRNDIALLGALLLIASVAFVHLMALPAFEDEGSQLRLVWRVIEAREWLQPLSDGKPLETWLMVPLVRLPGEPLAAIRAVHVLVGMLCAALTYRLGIRVTDRAGAWFGAGVVCSLSVCRISRAAGTVGHPVVHGWRGNAGERPAPCAIRNLVACRGVGTKPRSGGYL